MGIGSLNLMTAGVFFYYLQEVQTLGVLTLHWIQHKYLNPDDGYTRTNAD